MIRSPRTFAVVAFVVALAFPAAAATTPGSTQKDTEAAFIDVAVPMSDPCLIADVRGDVVDYVNHSQPTTFGYSAYVADVCTGTVAAWVLPLATDNLDGSQWDVEPALRGADLNATLSGFDPLEQLAQPITFDLHWSGNKLPDGTAAVTGTVAFEGLVVALDNSITWNPWGSPDFPWAGLWQCRFTFTQTHDSGPGCLGQA
jgi:hypothetical protein